jgi:putative membrane protein
MEPDPEDTSDRRPFQDPTRRTYLAQERTLLAWWRTGLAIVGVGVAVGKLIPGLFHEPDGPYVALGVGYGVVAAVFVIYGARRDRAVIESLKRGSYEELGSRTVWVFTALLTALVLGSIALIAWRP